MLCLNNLSKTFTKDSFKINALKDVSLRIKEKSVTALVGESGCGKTTLARILLGLDFADKGDGALDEREFSLTKKGRRCGAVFQMVFQNPYSSLDPRFTVKAILDEAACKAAYNDVFSATISVLREMRLSESTLSKYPHELSGGQRQRIAIARAVLAKPDVLVLDEPVSSLDVSVKYAVMHMMKKIFQKRSMHILLITHDFDVVNFFSEYVYVMKNGKIVEDGPLQNVITGAKHMYTQNLLKSVF